MFGWLGWREGYKLWWSYRLNREMKDDVEDIFEGIADTRKQLLTSWTSEYWGHLDRLSAQLHAQGPNLQDGVGESREMLDRLITNAYTRGTDFTELFVLSADGQVAYSTWRPHEGRSYGGVSPIAKGLAYAKEDGGRKCLFGPFVDELTLTIGPRSSSFHDEMTLLFIQPILAGGEWAGAVCGRVPNDVLGDLIQRESGHVYPDSGDNYIFMAKPGLNKQIPPGTALSRSRFEDRTFTRGDNLKDGVRTDWGIVSVKDHTELELTFTDPATGELHPGVANTIRNGSNLVVEFPGYSDYRHIPVIGKGVTFQLPHCPDVWGMMCEGDLEEVYRNRSVAWEQWRMQMLSFVGLAWLTGVLVYLVASQASALITAAAAIAFNLAFGWIMSGVVQRRTGRRTALQLRRISRFIRVNAEGKGDLTMRLPQEDFRNDETRDLAKWINNMIDSLEGIMLQVKMASADVLDSQKLLNESADSTAEATERMGTQVHDMIRSLRKQLKDIDIAKDVAGEMRLTLQQLEQQASEQIAVAEGEVGRIGDKMSQITDKVAETNGTIREFMHTAEEIRNVLQVIEEISGQTQLLALNASIEAARVGEHGRGFAVVASEIRKLADLTRQSTDEVHQIVHHIRQNAQAAYASMEAGTKVVEEGAELVVAASEILKSAKAEDTLKTQVVDEVVRLMENVAAVSMENRHVSAEVEGRVKELVDGIQHVRHTSHYVEAITAFLQQLVGQFHLTEARRR
ncbi:chemotaxis protein [Paenibacillus darwinianus]|uniref:Chemotaxis protein n=1 Tax=Paenibacillus darwinianus TaxID=1380763 RepID=A0A9W5W714_9BACL|nr:methyl-accepting chemotaxis protein [Paenibacillus darwinianus]EXX87369.1 chemotaxis protein [Paenibacillus darwinianus]EXX87416.1 chemotaxis protein [Paenibacillus darwinianus]EXX88825.1 chemotaxis protein [Paenibacillus darwinianus]